MATDLQPPSTEPSMGSLVSGIIDDAQALIRQQFVLLKTEVREDLHRTRDAALMLGLAALVGLVSLLPLTQAVALLLNRATGWEMWVCYGIEGVLLAGLGVGLALLGARKLSSAVPEQTVKALEENVEWKTNPK